MTTKNDQALIPLGERLPAAPRDQGDGSILQRMARGALDIAQRQALASARYRVGDYELAEPDYRQVLLWAESLELAPEMVLMRLAVYRHEMTASNSNSPYETIALEILDGKIRTLIWDCQDMPLEAFEWLPGLKIETLEVKRRMPTWPSDQYLTSLRRLFTFDMELSELDLSTVPGLNTLGCWDNQLPELNLSSVPGLSMLRCGNNRLTWLDLAPVKHLVILRCQKNQLTELDLTSVPELTELICWENQLTELDLRPVPDLAKLWCWRNQLKKLDLDPVRGLTDLRCGENKLTELDLRSVPNLTELWCDANELTELDLSPVPELTEIDCRWNPLTELDLRPVPKLVDLKVDADVRLIR